MKKIVVSYDIRQMVEIDVDKLSSSAKEFIKTFYKDDEDKTDEDWDIMESYSWYDVIGEATGEDESLMSEVELESFE